MLELCINNHLNLLTSLTNPSLSSLEICAPDSLDSGIGGLTPSTGLVQSIIKQLSLCKEDLSDLNISPIVRPRSGNHVYSPLEVEIITTDIKQLLTIREVSGLTIGCTKLDPDNKGLLTVDFAALNIWICCIKNAETNNNPLTITFHRAIDDIVNCLFTVNEKTLFNKLCDDDVPSISSSKEVTATRRISSKVAFLKNLLQNLGDYFIGRLLTSGGGESAWEGRGVLKLLLDVKPAKMKIVAAAGICGDNVYELVRKLPGVYIHCSGGVKSDYEDVSPPFPSSLFDMKSKNKALDSKKIETITKSIGRATKNNENDKITKETPLTSFEIHKLLSNCINSTALPSYDLFGSKIAMASTELGEITKCRCKFTGTEQPGVGILSNFYTDGSDAPVYYNLCLTSALDGSIIGYALFTIMYSTWTGRVIYLQELIINKEFRRKGGGSYLVKILRKLMHCSNAGRMSWQVEKGDTDSQKFFASEHIKAKCLPEWVNLRMTRDAMEEYTGAKDSPDCRKELTEMKPLTKTEMNNIIDGCITNASTSNPTKKTKFNLKVCKLTEEKDTEHILDMVRDLAVFEKEPVENVLVTTTDLIVDHFHSKNPAYYTLLLKDQSSGETMGFALFCVTYDLIAVPEYGRILYLEDLYIKESYRGSGGGSILMKALASIALNANCGRFQWQAIDWNEPAIKFYKQIGAEFCDHMINWNFDKEADKKWFESVTKS